MTTEYDWREPDIVSEFARRTEMLKRLRKMSKKDIAAVKAFYKENPAKFISDWGITNDPKQVEAGNPALIPFVLFPKQIEYVDEVIAHWKTQRPLLVEKSRQSGISWVSVALACTLCLFHPGLAIGFGSRKESYVDNADDPKSLFYKARLFLRHIPKELRGGWEAGKHAPYMRITIPETGASITGEAGDGIGRGATTSMYFVDEAAFVERPQLIEASLSQTTNCRIDVSTPNGSGNVFAQKRHSGKVDVFTLRWQDDPRKDQAWYEQQCSQLDAVTIAQELDISYSASVEGVVIPHSWVMAAVDAHLKLQIKPSGARVASLDVADEGKDKNALCGSHGIVIEFVEEWSGKDSDIYFTVEKAFSLCDLHDYSLLRYDSDGLGAGVRGDARNINQGRTTPIEVEAFRGSEGVFNPEGEDVKGRKNQDYFANRKAQSWWSLRTRFQKTFRAIKEGQEYNPDELISISSSMKNFMRLVSELSQPTCATNGVGKIVIDKAPDGTKSPNLADAVMIKFAPTSKPPMVISRGVVDKFAAAGLSRGIVSTPNSAYLQFKQMGRTK